MVISYAPLRCHSNFSFLYGPLSLDRLLEGASRFGYKTIGLTDTDGLYGAVEFYNKALEKGLKPLIGCEIETQIGRCVFLAKDLTGYGSLCRLSTVKMLYKRKPLLDDIAHHSHGLVLLYLDTEYLRYLKELFDDDFYMGIESSDDIRTRRLNRDKLNLSGKLSIKTITADPVYFLQRDDIMIHRALSAVKNLTTVADVENFQHERSGSFLHSPDEIRRLYKEYPETLKTTLEVAEKCNLELPVNSLNFPEYRSSGNTSNYQLLRDKTEAGLRRHYAKLSGEVYSRFESELAIINQTGYVDYFLIVSEIVDFCRKNNIPVVGRGSAASSIVSYALEITEIDPIAHDLYFARFLNEARSDPPDIDLDLCWRRRDEVLDFVYEKYGRNRVAMICTLNTFAARGAIRELGKVFGLSGDELSDFTKRLPWGKLGDLQKTSWRYPECKNLPLDKEPYRTIINLAYKIEGYPRHLSIHCGGIVISPVELLDLVPLQISAKGIAITQYDMHSIARLGLIKIDLLGQRGLSTITDGEKFAREKSGLPVRYGYNDKKTFELLQKGRTIGVFQIESPGLRALLIELKPKSVNDITLALALIRPGASESGMKKLFLERLTGVKPVEYPHPLLKSVLSETLGNIIYQEQVLRTAEALAGFSPAQADLLRRAMTKNRNRSEFKSIANRFISQALARGVSVGKAKEVFEHLSQFTGYGFCKAHATTYAELSYRASYLKAHFPIEYMAAMLNNFGGYYRSFVYADEARRLGAKLAPPDIDRPSKLCTTEDNNVLRIGLAFVKNLSQKTIEGTIRQRSEAPFSSLADFLVRVRPSVNEAENLISVGAFGFLSKTHPELLWYLKLYGKKLLKNGPNTLLLNDLLPPDVAFAPNLPDYSIDEKLAAELEIIEMAVTCHPTERIISGNGHVKSCELPDLIGRHVKIIGQVIDRKRIKTNKGKSMVFLSMEDAFDYFEVTLFPEIYRRFGQRIFKKPFLEVSGKVEKQHGVLTIIADGLEVCV